MPTTLDSFSAQIVALVRGMSDDAILALVRDQLGGRPVGAPSARRSRAKASYRRTRTSAPAARRGPRSTPETRTKLLETVERVVKAANGLSTSEIARKVGVPQSRAQAAVRELKAAKRIFQGGDRRFARYAGDPRSAQQASLAARK